MIVSTFNSIFFLTYSLRSNNNNLFLTSKNETTNSPIHQFTNIKYCTKAREPFKNPFSMVYYFLFITLKNISSLDFFHFKGFYLAHVIEQPNLRIPNPQYLQLDFCFDFLNDSENTF